MAVKAKDIARRLKEARAGGDSGTAGVLAGLLISGLSSQQRRIYEMVMDGVNTSGAIATTLKLNRRQVSVTLNRLANMGLLVRTADMGVYLWTVKEKEQP